MVLLDSKGKAGCSKQRPSQGKGKSDCDWPGLERRRAVRRAVPAPLLLRLLGSEEASAREQQRGLEPKSTHAGARPFPRFTEEVDDSRLWWQEDSTTSAANGGSRMSESSSSPGDLTEWPSRRVPSWAWVPSPPGAWNPLSVQPAIWSKLGFHEKAHRVNPVLVLFCSTAVAGASWALSFDLPPGFHSHSSRVRVLGPVHDEVRGVRALQADGRPRRSAEFAQSPGQGGLGIERTVTRLFCWGQLEFLLCVLSCPSCSCYAACSCRSP